MRRAEVLDGRSDFALTGAAALADAGDLGFAETE